MGKRVGMISLGCAKNQVNAEQMLYRLQQAGYTLQEDVDGADLVIVNTCGFIDSAKSEAIDNILAMGALKQEGRIGRLLVTGCLSQRYQDEILQEMPEVDGVLGTGSYDDIVSVADRLLNGGETVSEFGDIDAPADEAGRVLTTPQHMPTSRSPRAATISAPSASSPICAGATAAAPWRTSCRRPAALRSPASRS